MLFLSHTKQYIEKLALYRTYSYTTLHYTEVSRYDNWLNVLGSVYALRMHDSKCRSRQWPLSVASSADRATQWLAISTNAHAAPVLNNDALRRRSSVTSRVLRLCRIVLALLRSRHDNGIGAQRPILRQCLFRRCIHRRCTGASFPDSPCSRFTGGGSGPLLLPPRLTQLLDELDLSIERPSISIGTFSTSVTDACSPARDEQRA